MSKTFITFGGGGINYVQAGIRLATQAKSLDVFDNIILFTDDVLKQDYEFNTRHGEFVRNNSHRGYGYWIWKPYIIKKTMEKMRDGDILLYLDSGCEIDARRKDSMTQFFEIVKTDYIIGTEVCVERDFNKMDLLLKLDMLDNKYLDAPQRQGGVTMFLVCDKTRELVNEWYELACDYHNIDDSPSNATNFSSFNVHRHDQSIFSLLTKKHKIFSKHFLYDGDYRNPYTSKIYSCIEVLKNCYGYSRLN